MIINEYTKDMVNSKNVINPKCKRGYNQTPLELKEKLYHESHIKKNEKVQKKKDEILNLRNTMNKLKRF